MSRERGAVWLANLSPALGHEQQGERPVMLLSRSEYNEGPAQLVICLPLTRTNRGVLYHVPVEPPEGGLRVPSVVMCDQIRTLSRDRLIRYWGMVRPDTLARCETILRMVLAL